MAREPGRGKRERVFEAAKTGQKVECTIARQDPVRKSGVEQFRRLAAFHPASFDLW